MLNSNERMDFIIEYMSSYDEKIKMANKNGLFDAAKMFELFAIEVCNVWFGQKFSNLNDETATYPYVDLISENRELLVQVSTVQDVPTKIKTTLEKIRDSKDKKCSDLKNIVFFVLSNNSIDKVREYSGDNQIGSISFTIKDNLITTNDIITKAQNDLNFQKKLYKVLKDEYENFNINIRKFKGALELSNSGLKNIEGLINGEYEIDRNEFLEKITKDNERYISIQGGAGSGKSVLCKKHVENEKLVLYARAERFLEENHIDDIWGCCIQDVLECINGKKLIFFIDALEFIADCAETKFELLQYLYDMAAEYQNVYIVTSCRTSDKNAFIKLETNFSIKIYEVGDITEDELALLAEAIHLKSDAFTKNGLPIPVLETFAPDLAGKLYKSNYDSLCLMKDIAVVGTQAVGVILINMVISLIHGLYYDPEKYSSRDVYEVKTRKILLYSNLISTASNVLWVGGNAIAGNEAAWKDLDIGGIIVTMYRLVTDTKFIQSVKEEFVLGGFRNMIKGEDLNLLEVELWD